MKELEKKKMMKGGRNMSKQYTTISGDMWDGIAYQMLGGERHTDTLIKSNLKHRHIVIFEAGIVLDIPEIETEASLQLPPWKRRTI